MRALGYLFSLVLGLLISSVAPAQEPPKGFLGIDLKDIRRCSISSIAINCSRVRSTSEHSRRFENDVTTAMPAR
jgi:hypothetical protein